MANQPEVSTKQNDRKLKLAPVVLFQRASDRGTLQPCIPCYLDYTHYANFYPVVFDHVGKYSHVGNVWCKYDLWRFRVRKVSLSWCIFLNAVRKIISVCVRLYALSVLVSNDRSLGTLSELVSNDRSLGTHSQSYYLLTGHWGHTLRASV